MEGCTRRVHLEAYFVEVPCLTEAAQQVLNLEVGLAHYLPIPVLTVKDGGVTGETLLGSQDSRR